MTQRTSVLGAGNVWRRRRLRFSAPLASALLLPGLIALWFWVSEIGAVPPILLPSPMDVVESFPGVVGAGDFVTHIQRTIGEIVLGFIVGGGVGFGLGLLLGSSQKLRRAYLPFLSALQAVPKVILAPLIIAWFGFGISGKVAQAGVACFYAVFVTTLSGLELADADAIRLMTSLRASKWQTIVKVRIPSALPAIFGGLQIGATTAIIGAIVSEFVAADAGLGFLLLRYRSSFDTAAVFVLIFIFLFFGIISYLVLTLIERRVVFWRRTNVVRPDVSES